jgi:ABC-type antimicrobial peptide transport system permease subunit
MRVSPTDPQTYAIVILVLVAVAVLACARPARRATRTNPIASLRQD